MDIFQLQTPSWEFKGRPRFGAPRLVLFPDCSCWLLPPSTRLAQGGRRLMYSGDDVGVADAGTIPRPSGPQSYPPGQAGRAARV